MQLILVCFITVTITCAAYPLYFQPYCYDYHTTYVPLVIYRPIYLYYHEPALLNQSSYRISIDANKSSTKSVSELSHSKEKSIKSFRDIFATELTTEFPHKNTAQAIQSNLSLQSCHTSNNTLTVTTEKLFSNENSSTAIPSVLSSFFQNKTKSFMQNNKEIPSNCRNECFGKKLSSNDESVISSTQIPETTMVTPFLVTFQSKKDNLNEISKATISEKKFYREELPTAMPVTTETSPTTNSTNLADMSENLPSPESVNSQENMISSEVSSLTSLRTKARRKKKHL